MNTTKSPKKQTKNKTSSKKPLANDFLAGKKICLRPITASDINRKYLSWLNDAEVTKYIETGQFPVTKKDLEAFYNELKKSKTDVMFAIIEKKTGSHIGNIKLGGINWVHRYTDLGIMIGDKKHWGKGCGAEACTLLLEYAFNRLNLNKVFLGIYATHTSAIKTYQKAGFRIEGKLKNMLIIDGKYTDKILMGILSSEYNKNIRKSK